MKVHDFIIDDQTVHDPDGVHKLRNRSDVNYLKKSRRLGSISINDRIPRSAGHVHYTEKAIIERRRWAERVTGASLNCLSRSTLDPDSLPGNIENYIGAVQIPVGIAGPVLVQGQYTNNYVPVPIATTEGALVSSITRGAMACSLSGGIHVHVKRQHMLRAPVFFCENTESAIGLEKWVSQHIDRIVLEAESVSSVAKLLRIESDVLGDTLHLRFYYSTGDAAGQNMTTASTWYACEWITSKIKQMPEIQFKYYNIDGNMSGDKKANFQSFINGRGISATASCLIPANVLKRLLHISPEKYVEGYQAGEVGALQVGMMGANINFANVIAGIFTATGQDIACVHESSVGIFKVSLKKDGLYCMVSLPSLVIGTVGGGTGLPAQSECLSMMGCSGTGKVYRLAEIISAACLSLDLSTGAAIGANDFVAAHERLGRNRQRFSVSAADLTPRFFNSMLFDKKTTIQHTEKLKTKNHSGIITRLVQGMHNINCIQKFKLTGTSPKGSFSLNAVLKTKRSNRDIVRQGLKIAKMSGDDHLPGLFEAQSNVFGFKNAHIREIDFYNWQNNKIQSYCPVIYGTKMDKQQDLYAMLMEDLSDCAHIHTVNTPWQWNDQDIKTVLADMASMHAAYMDSYESIHRQIDIDILDENLACQSRKLLSSLTDFNAQRYPALIEQPLKDRYMVFTEHIDRHILEMKQFPMTLVHNDFNTRNLCLRKVNGHKCLVLYDWELVSYQNPQRDLIEFLVYVLDTDTSFETFQTYIDFYKQSLEDKTNRVLCESRFTETLYLNALYVGVVRFNLYLLAHNVLKFDFMERVYTNLARFIAAGGK